MYHHTSPAGASRRPGNITALVVVMLVVLVGFTAIALDGGLLFDNKRRVQSAADAAAMAAATETFRNYPAIKANPATPDPGGQAADAALASAKDNGFNNDGTTNTVVVNIPPKTGPFAGRVGYSEVTITYYQPRNFSAIWGGGSLPVVARAVSLGRWDYTDNGVIVLDPSTSYALDASGTGAVRVNGSAKMIVNSDNPAAARATGGGSLTADKFNITGNYTGALNGDVTTGTLPIPDPLAYLPAPTMPANGTITQTTVKGNKVYTLTPGRHNNLPNFGNGDTVILQQGGVYYIDGGGLTSTGGATIIMDPTTTGGVMIYNAPNGTQQNQGINISGGTVTLSPLTSGPYAGILLWQERSSPVSMSIQGQGGFTIYGTLYAANATLQVSGQGTNVIGSQYISRTLSLSGGGNTVIDYDHNLTARQRDIMLVE